MIAVNDSTNIEFETKNGLGEHLHLNFYRYDGHIEVSCGDDCNVQTFILTSNEAQELAKWILEYD